MPNATVGKQCSFEGCTNLVQREEFASQMAQRGNDAASRGAPTDLLRAEFVGRMVQKER